MKVVRRWHRVGPPMQLEATPDVPELAIGWLWEIGPESDNINNYYQWYHVYEDEINHRGEMHWRLSRMKLTT